MSYDSCRSQYLMLVMLNIRAERDKYVRAIKLYTDFINTRLDRHVMDEQKNDRSL